MTLQTMKDTNKKMEDTIMAAISQKVRDSMKKYDPIIEGFEDLKKFKSNFLELEDRFLDFQTKTQTKIVRIPYIDNHAERYY